MKPALLASIAALASLASCSLWLQPQPAPLASAHRAVDFASYDLRRVGLLPLSGKDLDHPREAELQTALRFELGRRAPYEIVLLNEADMAEIDSSRPHERGAYSTHAVIDSARRFRLDGLLVGTVTHFEPYAPQSIGLELELVAAETGLVVWSASLDIDTSDARVRRSIVSFQERRLDESGESGDLELMLLSPSHLMRFAASEVARTLPSHGAAVEASADR